MAMLEHMLTQIHRMPSTACIVLSWLGIGA